MAKGLTKEYKRDYLGSADAYDVFHGRYEQLAASKLKDSGFVSDQMQRGIQLERDVLEQYASSIPDSWYIDSQVRVESDRKGVPAYCKATLDGMTMREKFDGVENIEVKTSEKECPEDEADLKAKFPKYWYQVQWQAWIDLIKENMVLWCKCPPIASEESPYDDEGLLDVTELAVKPDPETWEVFEKNAPEAWAVWEKAKAADQGADSLELPRLDEYVSLQEQIEEKSVQLALSINRLKEKADEIRAEMLESMEAAGVLKYENDQVSITYVPSYTKKTVNTAKLKKAGIYDSYVKSSTVNASVRVSIKKEEE